MKKSTATIRAALALHEIAIRDGGTSAQAAAAEAFDALPWGPCGSYFVTHRAVGIGGSTRVQVWANRRPIAATWYGEGCTAPVRPEPGDCGRRRIGADAHAATRARADALRSWLRSLPATTRRAIAASWYGDGNGVELPGGWTYRPGQEGGYVELRAPWCDDRRTWWPVAPVVVCVGAGRAVSEALAEDLAAYAAEQRAAVVAAGVEQARAAAARQAEDALTSVRALRVSFGDRSACA